jgi:hypothetical protein
MFNEVIAMEPDVKRGRLYFEITITVTATLDT